MITQDERNLMRKYFRKASKEVWRLWLLGLVTTPLYGFGLVLLIPTSLIIYNRYRRIDDAAYDELLERGLEELVETGAKSLRLDASQFEQDPALIYAPRFERVAGAKIRYRKGKDKHWRYTPIEVTVIFFSEIKLCVYQCVWDVHTGNTLNEATKYFFYQDIVAMETESFDVTIEKDKIDKELFEIFPQAKQHVKDGVLQMRSRTQFILTTSAGKSLVVNLPSKKLLGMDEKGEVETVYADRAIASVERMLDDKRREMGRSGSPYSA